MLKIGNVEIKNCLVMAPMAGISNPAYIKICEEMGVGYAITELLSSEAIIRGNKKTFEMLNGYSDLKIPVALQLFGSNPNNMADAAKILEEKFHPSIIDINMGCPVPKVAIHSNAGSALLKEPDKVYEIVKSVVNAVSCPVTVKIRSGWDHDNVNAKEIAKICESAGASAICVHARTRSQGYSGKADWNVIKEVKENVNIPVIGNGDITDVYKAKQMLEETKCDFIMIGRALLGNPWIIKEIKEYLEENKLPLKINPIDRIDMCLKHFEYLLKYKNEKIACFEIRNHIAWYLKGLPNAKEIKEKIYKVNKVYDIIKILNEFKEDFSNEKK